MTTLQDSVLGVLTYEDQFDWFSGAINFEGKQAEIRVRFNAPPDKVSEHEVAKAREAYLALVARREAIETEIVREYLDLYNDSWRDGEIISREEFLALLEIESIDIAYGRAQAIWYTSGDLFTDHALFVRFNDDGSIHEFALG
jgi:hypothetical protein